MKNYNKPLKIGGTEWQVIKNTTFEGWHTSSELFNTTFENCVFKHLKMQISTINRCRFTNCYFQEVSFSGSTLEGNIFVGCVLNQVKFIGTQLLTNSINDSLLKECDFGTASSHDNKFAGSRFQNCNTLLTEWPLSCGSLNISASIDLKRQLAYHALSILTKRELNSLLKDPEHFVAPFAKEHRLPSLALAQKSEKRNAWRAATLAVKSNG